MAENKQSAAPSPRPVEVSPPPAGPAKPDINKNRYRALFKDVIFQHVSEGKVYKRGASTATQKIASVILIAGGILPLRGKIAAVQAKGKKAVPEFNTMGTEHTNCVVPPADDPSLVREWKEFKRYIANDLFMAWRTANPATADNTLPDSVTLDDVSLDIADAEND